MVGNFSRYPLMEDYVMRNIWKAGSFGLALVVMMVLSACGGGQVAGGGNGNALPTARPAENVGSGAKSAARDTYQATWDSYLRDAIAAQNQLQDINNSMRQRYEKPSITAQN